MGIHSTSLLAAREQFRRFEGTESKGHYIMIMRVSSVSIPLLAAASLIACTVNTQTDEATGGKSAVHNPGLGGGNSQSTVTGGATSVPNGVNTGLVGTTSNGNGGAAHASSVTSSLASGGASISGVAGSAGASYGTYAFGSSAGAADTASTTAAVSCLKEGPITEDTIWEPLAGCPSGFDVEEDVTISGTGTSLTIKPGVKLKFATNTAVVVRAGASLIAAGTAESPITFTGWQPTPGAWGGIVFYSSAIDNELRHVVVEYGGATDAVNAAVEVGYDTEHAYVKISNTQIRDSLQYGMYVDSDTNLAQFDNNTITRNQDGAILVDAVNVHQLKGTSNSLVDNGAGNLVRILTPYESAVGTDVTWPDLSPAVYRVSAESGRANPGIIELDHHLTIQPGAIFEFESGGGIEVAGPASGLSAIGTTDKPIVFRGINGDAWAGVGFCGSLWTGNALEEVTLLNAAGPATSVHCGGGVDESLLVGTLNTPDLGRAALRIKNLTISGPNSAPADISVMPGATLTEEGVNQGTGADGALLFEEDEEE